jgi:hypothetical protein
LRQPLKKCGVCNQRKQHQIISCRSLIPLYCEEVLYAHSRHTERCCLNV